MEVVTWSGSVDREGVICIIKRGDRRHSSPAGTDDTGTITTPRRLDTETMVQAKQHHDQKGNEEGCGDERHGGDEDPEFVWLQNPHDFDERWVYGKPYPIGHDFREALIDEYKGSVLKLCDGRWAGHVPGYGRGMYESRHKAMQVVKRYVHRSWEKGEGSARAPSEETTPSQRSEEE